MGIATAQNDGILQAKSLGCDYFLIRIVRFPKGMRRVW